MERCVVGLCMALLGLVAVDTSLEVDVTDLGDDWKYIGDLHPTDPQHMIGENLNMNCSTRRKILRKYNLSPESIYFKFVFHETSPNPIPVLIVDEDFLTVVTPNDASKKPNMVAMTFPNVNVTFDQAFVVCMLRINDTHEVEIESTTLTAGYKPAEAYIESVVTQDLTHLDVNITKTYRNPIYVTEFMVSVKAGNGERKDCMPPNGETNTNRNDSCHFDLSTVLPDPFRQNTLLEMYVTSSNHLPSKHNKVEGPKRTFYLYALYKPTAVTHLAVEYNDTQSAVVRWRYPKVPIPLDFFITYKSPLDGALSEVVHPVGYYTEGIIEKQLNNLRWGVTYDITIWGKPISDGYHGDRQWTTLTTAENVPDRNPVITRGGYTRHIQGDGHQSLVVYWEPVPEIYSNGKVTKMRLMIVSAGEVEYRDILDIRARQQIERLRTDVSYNIAVEAGTSKGMNKRNIHVMIEVPPLEHSLVNYTGSNMTAIADGDTGSAAKSVWLSWTTSNSIAANTTVHWCEGKHGNIGKCYPAMQLYSDVIVTEPGKTYEYHLVLDRHFNHYVFGISVETSDSTSGISWSSCTYDITKVSPPPEQSRDHHTSTTSITLYLHKPPCAEQGGFIHTYRVEVVECLCSEAESCKTGVKRSVLFMNTSRSDYTIDDLQNNQDHRVRVYSITHQGESYEALTVCAKTVRIRIEIYIGVSAAAVLLLVIIIVLIVGCRQHLKHKNKPIEIIDPKIPTMAVDPVPRSSDRTYDNPNPDPKYAKIGETELLVQNHGDAYGQDLEPETTAENTDCPLLCNGFAQHFQNSPFARMAETVFQIPEGHSVVVLCPSSSAASLANDVQSGQESEDNVSSNGAASTDDDKGESSGYLATGQGFQNMPSALLSQGPPADHRVVMENSPIFEGNIIVDGTGKPNSGDSMNGQNVNGEDSSLRGSTHRGESFEQCGDVDRIRDLNPDSRNSSSRKSDIDPYPKVAFEEQPPTDQKDPDFGNNLDVSRAEHEVNPEGLLPSDKKTSETNLLELAQFEPLNLKACDTNLAPVPDQTGDDDSEVEDSLDEDNADSGGSNPNTSNPYCTGQIMERPIFHPREAAETGSWPLQVCQGQGPHILAERADSGVYSPDTSPAIHSSSDSPLLLQADSSSDSEPTSDNDMPDEGNCSLVEGDNPWGAESNTGTVGFSGYSSGVTIDRKKLATAPHETEHDPYKRGIVIRS